MAWPGSEVDQQERGSKAIRLEDAMSMFVESILRQKGADVATIVPEASVKRATSWLHAKNDEREIVHAIARYGETATSMPVSEIMRRGVITVSPTTPSLT